VSYSQALEAQMKALQFWTSKYGYEAARFHQALQLQLFGLSMDVDAIRQVAARDLQQADPFYIDPSICDTLVSVAEAMPLSVSLQPEMAPSIKGFAFFAKPVKGVAGDGIERTLCGFAWAPYSEYKVQVEEPLTEGLSLRWYEYRDGDRITPMDDALWPYGDTVGGWKPASPRKPSDELDGKLSDQLRRLVLALFSFCAQRILVASGEQAVRATRKRADEFWYRDSIPLIQVIKLRRAQNHQHSDVDGSEPVEWSCSWVVRGHWRQQACGDNWTERRPVFVLPYVKGDPEKPLKAPVDRVFAVTR